MYVFYAWDFLSNVLESEWKTLTLLLATIREMRIIFKVYLKNCFYIGGKQPFYTAKKA